MKCKITKTHVNPNSHNEFSVSFEGLTRGSIYAMLYALDMRSEESANATDLRTCLRNGIMACDDQDLKKDAIELLGE